MVTKTRARDRKGAALMSSGHREPGGSGPAGFSRSGATTLGGIVWPGFGGFLVGAACVWAHDSRVRAELSASRWAAEHDGLTGLPNRAGIL